MAGVEPKVLTAIGRVMVQACDRFPSHGECAKRAFYIRNTLGYGDVITFLRGGLRLSRCMDFERMKLGGEGFKIPSRDGGAISVSAYHSIYVYGDRVFTPEIDSGIALDEYVDQLKQLNGEFLKLEIEQID